MGMLKKKGSSAGTGSPPKRQRYWSVMLVGEHGRVIPFRHFKAIVVATIGLLLASLLGLAVLGALYVRQGRSVDRLQSELDTARQQAAQLRDEKDVLHASLALGMAGSQPAAGQKTAGAAGDAPAQSGKDTAPAPAPEPVSRAEPAPEPVARAAPVAAEKPRVRWQADIRQFDVNHNPQQELLEASFRIYNTTSPRQALAGSIVVVFRNDADPKVARLPLPAVPLSDGKPAAKGGQGFRINNYRTMRFRAERQKAPIAYNAVTVFVFQEGGALLLEREFEVDIFFEAPPEPEAPPPAAPETGALEIEVAPRTDEQGREQPGPASEDSDADDPGSAEDMAPPPEGERQ